MPLKDLDWAKIIEWLRGLDWGSVPAWAGALSLFLAFRVFLRDRSNAERAQVDLIGVWATWHRFIPETLAEKPYDITVRICAKNASELPVQIVRLAYEIETQWIHKGGMIAGKPTQGFADRIWVPPQEPLEKELTVSVADSRPEGALMLAVIPGQDVDCTIRWLLLVDNAGRKWEVRPGKGSRAKRVKWYRRRRQYRGVQWEFTPQQKLFPVTRKPSRKLFQRGRRPRDP
jgi:hypothetical protein